MCETRVCDLVRVSDLDRILEGITFGDGVVDGTLAGVDTAKKLISSRRMCEREQTVSDNA